MVIRITSKCNMKCAHCCYSCRPGKGEHMSLWTFDAAIRFVSNYSEMITLSGGEPTVHPDFFNILDRCLSCFDYVWFATNGKKTRTMWKLIEKIEDEELSVDKIGIDLSLDPWHEPIDPKIESFFRRKNKYSSWPSKPTLFGIRDVSQSKQGVVSQGRAQKNRLGYSSSIDQCICSDLIVQPNGDVALCGCKKAPVICNVNCETDIPDHWLEIINSEEFKYSGCWTEYQKQSKRKED